MIPNASNQAVAVFRVEFAREFYCFSAELRERQGEERVTLDLMLCALLWILQQ